MEGTSATASVVINFVENLEENTFRFYEELAEKHFRSKDLLLSFARDSRKNKVVLTRTYRETITDALEACFCFKGLILPEIEIQDIKQESLYLDDLKTAIDLERKAVAFYLGLARCSGSLLSTITRSFERVGQTRDRRIHVLESLLKTASA